MELGRPVSRLPSSPNAKRICRKSPAATKYSRFGKPAAETGLDRYCTPRTAVKFTILFSSRSVVLGPVGPVLPPEDGNRLNFEPVKLYHSRLLWRDRSGKAQGKLLLTSPEDILAICDPRHGRYCRHGKGGFPRQALPQTDKLTGLEARHAYGVTRLCAPPAPSLAE